jgi:hypothetical protein
MELVIAIAVAVGIYIYIKRTNEQYRRDELKRRQVKEQSIIAHAKSNGSTIKPPPNGTKGYVYILNTFGNGLPNDSACKIGFTQRVPFYREKELSDSAMYRGMDFYLFCYYEVIGCYEVEQEAHRILSLKKLWGELFDVNVEDAKGAIESAIEGLETAALIDYIDQSRAIEQREEFNQSEYNGKLEAARIGSTSQQFELSLELRRGMFSDQDFQFSLDFLIMAAKGGDPEAQHQLGIEYAHGRFVTWRGRYVGGTSGFDHPGPLVEFDLDKSKTWLEKAANNDAFLASEDLKAVNEEMDRILNEQKKTVCEDESECINPF